MINSEINSMQNNHLSLIEENGQPFVYYKNEKWDRSRLFSLVDNCQDLKENAFLLSKIVYHLLLKNDYNEIENIEEFKIWYRRQIDLEKTINFDSKDHVKITDYGSSATLKDLHGPKIENQELEFYVIDALNIPYVVKMPLNDPKVICRPLNIEENTEEVNEEKISLI